NKVEWAGLRSRISAKRPDWGSISVRRGEANACDGKAQASVGRRARRYCNAQLDGGFLNLATAMNRSNRILCAVPHVKPLVAGLLLPLVVGEFACPGVAAAATLPVTNCNDAGGGSLRAAMAAAHSGDTVDMTGLTCGKISLATGELNVPVDNLTLQGPGANL